MASNSPLAGRRHHTLLTAPTDSTFYSLACAKAARLRRTHPSLAAAAACVTRLHSQGGRPGWVRRPPAPPIGSDSCSAPWHLATPGRSALTAKGVAREGEAGAGAGAEVVVSQAIGVHRGGWGVAAPGDGRMGAGWPPGRGFGWLPLHVCTWCSRQADTHASKAGRQAGGQQEGR